MGNSVLLCGGFVCMFVVFVLLCLFFFFKSEVSFHGYADVQVCKGYVISGTVEEVC